MAEETQRVREREREEYIQEISSVNTTGRSMSQQQNFSVHVDARIIQENYAWILNDCDWPEVLSERFTYVPTPVPPVISIHCQCTHSVHCT